MENMGDWIAIAAIVGAIGWTIALSVMTLAAIRRRWR